MDLSQLTPRIETHLSERSGGDVSVRDLRPLFGGACQDNLRLKATFATGELAGEQTLVLRSDAPLPLQGSLDRSRELAVIQAAVAAGVTTPPVYYPGQSLVREGAQAYFMAWRPGVAIGRKVLRDADLAPARERLPETLAAELTRIHGITPATHPDLSAALGPPPGDPAQEALGALRTSLDEGVDLRPASELVYRWLARNAPRAGEVTLVHGDFRTGNFLICPEGLSAVLDWEFAHWGAPAEDLAWLCVRDWRFGQLDRPAGGFATRAAMRAGYEAASGRSFDPALLHWWEVLGNLRWGAGCLQQGRRYTRGQQQDLELIAISRRAVEMEYEALRLIEVGP